MKRKQIEVKQFCEYCTRTFMDEELVLMLDTGLKATLYCKDTDCVNKEFGIEFKPLPVVTFRLLGVINILEDKKGLTRRTNVPPQGAAQMLSDLPEKATREQSQVYPNTRDLQEGGAAFALGNYQKAIAVFMPLAKQGNPLAQATLSMMHYLGKGVSQNYQEVL